MLDKGTTYETKNFSKGGFTVKITYFQKEKNEADQLEKADEIRGLFGMVFVVGNRKLKTNEYSFVFIGQYSDILQINIDFDYMENTSKEDNAPLADTVHVNIRRDNGESTKH